MIPYGRQDISQADIDAVVETLRSDWLTQGPAVPRFEEKLGAAVGATHVVAMSSATAALHVACLALGLGPGDRLWTVPNTFVASANCGLYCGATVDFVDIDATTRNIDVGLLAAKLEVAKAAGTLPKVVVPVDFAGTSVDMEEIRRLADLYGFAILEDASHAVGGSRGALGGFAHSYVAPLACRDGGATTYETPALMSMPVSPFLPTLGEYPLVSSSR